MVTPVIQPSFAAGELAPQLWGRVDLAKYATGAATLRNMFVDYRGGVSSRPGTLFCGPGFQPGGGGNSQPLLIPFIFSSEQAYVLELGAGFMRIVTQGGYILENPLNITAATNTTDLTITVPGNDFTIAQLVVVDDVVGLTRPTGISGVNGRTFSVQGVAGDVVTLAPAGPGLVNSTHWSAYVSGGTMSRVYTVDTPWQAEDLFALDYAQSVDVLTVVHPNYPPTNISRLAATDWTVEAVVIGSDLAAPLNVLVNQVVGSGGTGFQYFYVVTTINTVTNEESAPSLNAGGVNGDNATNIIQWNTSTSPSGGGYRIYKAAVVPSSSGAVGPYIFGYIGSSISNNFIDTNFEPDFAIVPPNNTNPFNAGPVASAQVIASSTGFLAPIVVPYNVQGGSGATFSANINAEGTVTSISVDSVGVGYTEPPQLSVIENNTVPGTGAIIAFNNTWVPVALNPAIYPPAQYPPPAIGWNPDPTSFSITSGGSNYHIPDITFGPTVPLPPGTLPSNIIGGGSGSFIGLITLVNGVAQTSNVVTGGVLTALGPITPVLPGTPCTITSDGLIPSVDPTIDWTIAIEDQPISSAYGVTVLDGTNFPGHVSYFDQRRFYGDSDLNPDGFWASRPGQFDNFDTSFPSQPGDSLSGTIVGEEVNAIASLTAMASGLIALTSGGAYQISGGTPGAALTPTTITAQAQAFSGASPLKPLRIGTDLVYKTARGSAIRDLAYNFYVNVYTGTDISALSSHLFYGRDIVQWAYAEEPFKLAWAVRDDGVMLSITYMKEQEIYGWARHDTCGQYGSVCVIPENGEDTAYVSVSRLVNGAYSFVTERIQSRTFGGNPAMNVPSDPEKAWCVDAGVQTQSITPDANITDGSPLSPGQIFSVTISDGGSGYPEFPYVQILDDTGTGAQISLTVVDGVITAGTVITAGIGYSNAVVEIAGGVGAAISVNLVNPWLFNIDGAGLVFSFTSDNIGQVLRVGGGRGVITSIPTAGGGLQAIAAMDIVPALLVPNATTQIMAPVVSGQWSLADVVTAVGGLDHLEGSAVQLVADGNVLSPAIVVDGCITLPQPASLVLVGAGFSAQVQTLRIDAGQPTIQSKRKAVRAVTLRVVDTRGVEVGPIFEQDYMVPVKERNDEDLNQPTKFQVGGGMQIAPYVNGPLSPNPLSYDDQRQIIMSIWNDNGQVCIQQNYPMPMTILADIIDLSVGDTA